MALVQYIHKGCGGTITWTGQCSKCQAVYLTPRRGMEGLETKVLKP